MTSKIRYGMIGGGSGALIGAAHRKAAALDNKLELVCGAFSSNHEKSKASGEELGLNPSRVYGSFKEMIESEKQLPADIRLQAVSIVTPNHVHFEPAMMALENGFHVIIDKPITFSLEEAKKLHQKVNETGLVLALTHTYTGYPMVKEMRHRIGTEVIGEIRKVYVEYLQGWLSTFLENDGHKQASWRTDPSKSGAGGSTGDIGTHAANLAEYVTGLHIKEVSADINIVVDGRKLDDDSAALLRFDSGASGVLIATQVAAGEDNYLNLRIYGEKGGFEWKHSDHNTLLFKPHDAPIQVICAGSEDLSEVATSNLRLPVGHHDGHIEAFANIYVAFANAITDYIAGTYNYEDDYDFPGVEDGVRGMAFVETMVRSGKSSQKWTKIEV